jgi:uncharacterized protein (TIGR02996 family)
MSAEDAFLQAICAEPEDDGPRLVYADWLDERGDVRGEFIRVQIELARGPADEAKRAELAARERALLAAHREAWLGPLRRWLTWAEFRRGFPEAVVLQAEQLLECAGELFRLAPIREVKLSRARAWLPQLAALPLLARIRFLDLSGDQGARTILSGDLTHLTASPYLGELSGLRLRHHPFNDAGLRALARPRSFAGLESLDLSNVGLTADGVAALNDPAVFPRLTALCLRGNRLRDAGAGELAWARRAAGLRSLNLADNGLTRAAVPTLTSGRLHQLTELDLSRNPLGGGLEILAGPSFPELRRLRLNRCRLVGPTLQPLSQLPPLSALSLLDLSGNALGTQGARLLAASTRLAGLTELDLSGNEIGNRGAEALAESPYLAHLGVLRLAANGLGVVGLRALLASPHLSRLHTLELGGNRLGDAGAIELSHSPRLGQLVRLGLRNNRLGDAGAAALADAPQTGRLWELDLSYNELTRDGAGAVALAPLCARRPGLAVRLDEEVPF